MNKNTCRNDKIKLFGFVATLCILFGGTIAATVLADKEASRV